MSRRRSGLPITTVGLAFLLMLTGGLATAQPVHPGTVTGSRLDDALLTTVEQYVEAFAVAYRPAEHELEALRVAEASLRAAEHTPLPKVTVGQSLDWDDFAQLSLDLEAGIEVPLVTSTAAAARALADFDLQARQLAQREAREMAKASLLMDLANLAAVTWAQHLVTDAGDLVARLDLPWLVTASPPAVGAGPPPQFGPDLLGYVRPAERDSFDMVLRLNEVADWLQDQHRTTLSRLAGAVAQPESRLQSPSLDDIALWLADKSMPSALERDLAACLASTSQAEIARLRRSQFLANDHLVALPEYSLALTANVQYAAGPWPSSASPPGNNGGVLAGDLSGAVALEARYLVPEGWPFGGNASLDVTPNGMHQRIALAWPPLPVPRRVIADREQELADEMEAIAGELRAMRSASAQATGDREQLQRQLLWAIVDAAPDLGAEVVADVLTKAMASPTVRLLERYSGDPLLELEIAELRLQHLFARLTEVIAKIQYLSTCGRL